MSTSPTILILTSKTGGGHLSLAEALRDRLKVFYTIKIVDPQPHFFHQHYRFVSRHALWLWSAEFRFTNTTHNALIAHRLFTKLVTRPLQTVLDQLQPGMIIATYPFFTYEVMRVLEKRSSSIPFAMHFSDAKDVHSSWLTERNAAAVLAPTRETYSQALHAGFDASHLHLVGWPVRDQFYRCEGPTRIEMLTRLNLDPGRFTIFLQGGAEGGAKFVRGVENILAASSQLQVILAVGTNQALLEHFKGIQHVYALPFTRDIADYMAAADVIMGKAGPNILFESITLCKPFIATTYIPGQEEGNLDLIRQHQLGWVALNPDQQRDLLSNLPTNQDLASVVASVIAYREQNIAAQASLVPLIHSLIPPL